MFSNLGIIGHAAMVDLDTKKHKKCVGLKFYSFVYYSKTTQRAKQKIGHHNVGA